MYNDLFRKPNIPKSLLIDTTMSFDRRILEINDITHLYTVYIGSVSSTAISQVSSDHSEYAHI